MPIFHLFDIFIVVSSRFYLIFRKYTINSVSIEQVHYEFTIESRIYYRIANSLWISSQFCEYIKNSLYFSRIHYLYRENIMNLIRDNEFTVCFAIWLWIYVISLSLSRIYFDFTIFFANLLFSCYLLREFTIYFAN